MAEFYPFPHRTAPNFKIAFADQKDSESAAIAYLHDLRSNWSDCEKSASRASVLVTVLGGISVLINERAVRTVGFGGVDVDKLYLVAAAIPPIVGYLGYVISLNMSIVSRLLVIHDAAYRDLQPKFWQEQLHLTLHPVDSWHSMGTISSAIQMGEFSGRIRLLAFVRVYFLLVLPLGVTLYTLVELWSQSSDHFELALASTVISGLFILAALPLAVASRAAMMPPTPLPEASLPHAAIVKGEL
jgi:hypothetical protein